MGLGPGGERVSSCLLMPDLAPMLPDGSAWLDKPATEPCLQASFSI